MRQRLRTVPSHGLHAPQLAAPRKYGLAGSATVIFQTANCFVRSVGGRLAGSASFAAAAKLELEGSICIVVDRVSASNPQNCCMNSYTRKANVISMQQVLSKAGLAQNLLSRCCWGPHLMLKLCLNIPSKPTFCLLPIAVCA